jgi:hypothetical protein
LDVLHAGFAPVAVDWRGFAWNLGHGSVLLYEMWLHLSGVYTLGRIYLLFVCIFPLFYRFLTVVFLGGAVFDGARRGPMKVYKLELCGNAGSGSRLRHGSIDYLLSLVFP